MHVVLVISINDENSFLHKIVKITGFFSIRFLCSSTAGCTIYKFSTCITNTARKERKKKTESDLINRFNKPIQYGGYSVVVVHFSSVEGVVVLGSILANVTFFDFSSIFLIFLKFYFFIHWPTLALHTSYPLPCKVGCNSCACTVTPILWPINIFNKMNIILVL